jgi:plastocyanin
VDSVEQEVRVMTDRHRAGRVLGAVSGGALVAGLVAGTALAADQAVNIAGQAFDPASVTVSVGDSVTWTNADGVAHTATADDASFDTGNIAAGGSDSVTFSTAGSFPYHCAIHPAMTGTVTVQAAAGGSGGGGGGGAAATPPATDAASPAQPTASTPIALLTLAAVWLLGIVLVAWRFAARR